MFLVREFWANVLDVEDNKDLVRCMFVPFGPSDINSFYGVTDVG